MISFLSGQVITISEGSLILNVHGIGLSINVVQPEVFQKNKEISLFIHMQWHQENGPSLYGFLSEQEKILFLMIIDCSGFGPKAALLILKKFSPLDFLKAIQSGDIKVFSSVSGIGPKKSEQLVVQLKHKISSIIDKPWITETGQDAQMVSYFKDISQALQALHYSRQEVDNALGYIAKESADAHLSFDVLLRKALSFLAKKT